MLISQSDGGSSTVGTTDNVIKESFTDNYPPKPTSAPTDVRKTQLDETGAWVWIPAGTIFGIPVGSGWWMKSEQWINNVEADPFSVFDFRRLQSQSITAPDELKSQMNTIKELTDNEKMADSADTVIDAVDRGIEIREDIANTLGFFLDPLGKLSEIKYQLIVFGIIAISIIVGGLVLYAFAKSYIAEKGKIKAQKRS